MAARAWIGISGWSYPPWRGVFYPKGLRQASELNFASRQFTSIEINGTFYSLTRPDACQFWYDEAPEGFIYAVKGGRYITHLKRLKDPETALANFFASGLLRLGEKLGPILWQLPPQLKFDRGRLRDFFELLPKTMSQAAALAKRHDQRLSGRSDTRARVDLPLRHAVEVRHPSFMDAAYVELLRQYGIASCVADSAGLYPVIEDVSTDFMYVRLHGAEQLYVSGYGPKALRAWAARVRAWMRGEPPEGARLLTAPTPRVSTPRCDVYVYFDNDVKVRAPFDAANLQRLVDGRGPLRARKSNPPITEEPRSVWPAWQGGTVAAKRGA